MWLWSIGRVQVIHQSECVVMEHIEAGRGGGQRGRRGLQGRGYAVMWHRRGQRCVAMRGVGKEVGMRLWGKQGGTGWGLVEEMHITK